MNRNPTPFHPFPQRPQCYKLGPIRVAIAKHNHGSLCAPTVYASPLYADIQRSVPHKLLQKPISSFWAPQSGASYQMDFLHLPKALDRATTATAHPRAASTSKGAAACPQHPPTLSRLSLYKDIKRLGEGEMFGHKSYKSYMRDSRKKFGSFKI